MRYDPSEPVGGVKTKIVATVGPATRDPAMLAKLVEAGVDVFRLNFSHGTHEEHSGVLAAIRELGERSGRVIGVLMDLCGPKIRLGELPGGSVHCELNDVFILAREPDGDPKTLTCSYPELPDDLTTGGSVLFADGAVAMEVIETATGRATLRVTLPGEIRTRQGINVPGAALGIPSLTEKDLADLDWPGAPEVDYVALSFVRTGADVARLRQELQSRQIHALVVSKIEKPQAVEQLESILSLSDAVMVARGDLGVELDVARVPAIQKQIIKEAHRMRVPVITATQMLNSMEHAGRPTRAEASDVFNAVVDGTDAVMLSGETAVGEFPVEAVRTMSRILAEAERTTSFPPAEAPAATRVGWVSPITEAVVEAARLACQRLDAGLLVVATRSGRSALAVSMQRSKTTTVALTDDDRVARRLALFWGVLPIGRGPGIDQMDAAADYAIGRATAQGLVAPGDRVVILRGFVSDDPTHNAMIVREIGPTP